MLKKVTLFSALPFLMGLSYGSAALASLSMDEIPRAGVYLNSDGSPLLPLLKNATKTIDIEIYTMKDITVRNLLRDAMKRGVTLQIIQEPKPVGVSCDVFGTGGSPKEADCADEQSLVSEVRAAGGTYEPFNKANLCPNGGGKGGTGCYEHGKIALADGIALVSTGNFDSTNLCIDNTKTCNRDYSMMIEDPTTVSTIKSIFEADLRGQSYNLAAMIPNSLQGILTVSPDSLQPMVDFINSAKTSIDFETQYLEEPTINAALEAAAKRGVQVSVTVSSICAFGTPAPSAALKFKTTYSSFDGAGISSKMFNASNKINGHAGYMHAKALVVDHTHAWLGSENGSTESMTQNREYGVIFDDAQWVDYVLGIVTGDHDSADSETWEQSLVCEKDHGSSSVDTGTPAAPKKPKAPPKKKPAPHGFSF